MKNIRQAAKGLGVGGAALALVAGGALLAGGAAVAAGTITSGDIADQTIQSRDIGPGGVGSSEIRNNTIRQHDIGEAAVGSSEIRDGRILMQDFAPDTVEQLKGEPGTPGADGKDGADGADGADGEDGAPGVANPEVDGIYTQVFKGGMPDTLQKAVIECAEGKIAVGGGYSRADEAPASIKNLQIVTSAPNEDTGWRIKDDPEWSRVATGWKVEGFNLGDTDLIVRPWVVCADVELGSSIPME